jgi:hypothetical protein
MSNQDYNIVLKLEEIQPEAVQTEVDELEVDEPEVAEPEAVQRKQPLNYSEIYWARIYYRRTLQIAEHKILAAYIYFNDNLCYSCIVLYCISAMVGFGYSMYIVSLQPKAFPTQEPIRYPSFRPT